MLAKKSSFPAGQNAVGEVAIDLPLQICVYKNGRIEQVQRSPFVPASEDPGLTGVATRDVVINRETGVAARLFLPTGAVATGRRLPLVVFFHGGVAAESVFCRTYHRYATSLAARAAAIVVSVEYRLAPEHPVTAADDDAWNALRWAASLADPWLLYHTDRRCTFLAGDGGGIAYRTAVRASRAGVDIDVEGLLLMDLYFWEPGWLPYEKAVHGGFLTPAEIAQLPCRRALVAVAGKGAAVRERGRSWLAARVCGCWWGGEVTIVELHGEDHGFHLYGPASASTEKLMESIVEFVNEEERDQGSVLRDKNEVPSGVLDGAEVAPSLSNGSCNKAVPVDVARRTVTKSCL